MFSLLKNILCCSLSLLLTGCFAFPDENIPKGRISLEASACGADRLKPFRKPPLPLLVSSESDLGLLSPGREEKPSGRSASASVLRPRLGKKRNHFAYTVQTLAYPSAEAAGKEVSASFYLPSGGGPFSAIVVLPITNGDYFTEHFAGFLAEQGFAILRYESRGEFEGLLPPSLTGRGALQQIKNYFQAYVVDVLRGIDWLETQPIISRSQIGLFGISQGAIVGSAVAGLDSRVASGVFILGGGGLAGIFSSTEEKRLSEIRNRILSSGEFSQESLRREAEAALLPIDPLTYAKCVRPSTILLVDARFDRIILPAYAELLWEGMGKPPRIQLPTGHYTAGLFLPYIRSATLRHFQTTLK